MLKKIGSFYYIEVKSNNEYNFLFVSKDNI